MNLGSALQNATLNATSNEKVIKQCYPELMLPTLKSFHSTK